MSTQEVDWPPSKGLTDWRRILWRFQKGNSERNSPEFVLLRCLELCVGLRQPNSWGELQRNTHSPRNQSTRTPQHTCRAFLARVRRPATAARPSSP
eukprot:4992605-Prymnesium_polylepis.1